MRRAPPLRDLGRFGPLLATLATALVLSGGGYYMGRVQGARALVTPDEINTVEVVRGALPGVVRIDARVRKDQLQEGEDPVETGSGFFYKPNLILTNYHVIALQDGITVKTSDGRSVSAKLEGVDPGIDIAILRVGGLTAPKTLPFGTSANLVPGQKLLVIGSPQRYQNYVSTGIFSTYARTAPAVNADTVGLEIDQHILTSASILPGNSGGPVLDSRGAVVAVAGANSGTNDLVPGLIGVAIPIDLVKQSVQDLESGGVPQRGTLGVSLVNLSNLDPVTRKLAGLASPNGALVDEVPAGSAGARAGLQGSLRNSNNQLTTLGDVIVAVDGRAVSNQYDVIRAVATKRPGDSVTLKLWRNKKQVNVKVSLIKRSFQ